jgi:hypothetical protein
MPTLMAFTGDSSGSVHACFFFFFFFVDKLCTNAITLMVFTRGWGQRWVSTQALTCLLLYFYLIIFYTLIEYIVICVSTIVFVFVFVSIYFIFI